MLPPSDLLTILWVVPRFLGELDSANAMISAKAGFAAKRKEL